MEYVSSIERIKLEQKLHEGIDLGVEQGEATMLSRLLTRRFGDLPQWAQEQVKNAAKAQIEAWFDRAIDADALDHVFQDMPH